MAKDKKKAPSIKLAWKVLFERAHKVTYEERVFGLTKLSADLNEFLTRISSL